MVPARKHITFANVVSVVALFVALGGGAYAITTAPDNTVVSSSIENGQVKQRDLAHNAVVGRKVKDDSLAGKDINESTLGQVPTAANAGHATTADSAAPSGAAGGDLAGTFPNPTVADNSLTGDAIDESTLGTVPNADKLDGIDSSGFIRGSGQIIPIATSVSVTQSSGPIVEVPGFFHMDAFCGGTGSNGQYAFRTFSDPVTIFTDNGGANPTRLDLTANSSSGSAFWATLPGGDALTFSIDSSTGKIATAFLFSYAFHSVIQNDDICVYRGQVIVTGA